MSFIFSGCRCRTGAGDEYIMKQLESKDSCHLVVNKMDQSGEEKAKEFANITLPFCLRYGGDFNLTGANQEILIEKIYLYSEI